MSPLKIQVAIGFLKDFFSSTSSNKTIHYFSIVFIVGKSDSGGRFGRADQIYLFNGKGCQFVSELLT